MTPPLLLAAAMRVAVRDAVGAADLLLLRVWMAYLLVRGWVTTWARSPAGYRTLRAETRHAPGVLVVLYEHEALTTLDAVGIDAPARYQRGVMRLAVAEGRPPLEVLGDLLTLQAWWFSREDERVLAARVIDTTSPQVVPVAVPANDGATPPARRGTSLDEFLKLHPKLLPVLARLARDAVRAHGARVSINALFERLRADLDLYREVCGGTLPPKTRNGLWRLDNSHRAAVGRLLAASDPELAGHLDLRRSRADQDPLVTARFTAAEARARRAS
jgi:hypothetical protein